MKRSNKNISGSLVRYLPIIIVNVFLIFMFLQAYITDNDVHPFYALMMMAIWFFVNLACIFIMDAISKKEQIKVDVDLEEIEPKKKDSLYFIIPWIKYLVIAYVNYLLLVPITNMTFLAIMFYNLFCFYFIFRMHKSRDREFYCFIMIILPVLVGFVWDVIV